MSHIWEQPIVQLSQIEERCHVCGILRITKFKIDPMTQNPIRVYYYFSATPVADNEFRDVTILPDCKERP